MRSSNFNMVGINDMKPYQSHLFVYFFESFLSKQLFYYYYCIVILYIVLFYACTTIVSFKQGIIYLYSKYTYYSLIIHTGIVLQQALWFKYLMCVHFFLISSYAVHIPLEHCVLMTLCFLMNRKYGVKRMAQERLFMRPTWME